MQSIGDVLSPDEAKVRVVFLFELHDIDSARKCKAALLKLLVGLTNLVILSRLILYFSTQRLGI